MKSTLSLNRTVARWIGYAGIAASMVFSASVMAQAGTIQFSSATYPVTEGVPSVALTLTRTGGSVGAVAVTWTTSNGGAATGSDFGVLNNLAARTGTVTWPAGDVANKTVLIPILNDTVIEASEDFYVNLTNPTNGAVLGAINSTTVTISDNDSFIEFAPTVYQVNESDGTVTIFLYRTGLTTGTQAVTYNTGGLVGAGNATSGSDYTAQVAKIITFAPGEENKSFTIPIANDTLVEGNEVFTVTLSAPTGGAVLGVAKTATITIVDNENGIGFETLTKSVFESGGNVSVQVNRYGSSSGAVSVNYTTANVTALVGADYTLTTGTLNWTDGDTSSQYISVPIVNDSLVDLAPAKTFRVNLSGPVGAGIAGQAYATVTINDDDTVFQYTLATFAATEGAATANLIVSRTGNAALTGSVNYNTVNGTAVAGTDFGALGNPAAVTGTINWAAGDKLSKTISIPLLNDGTTELAKAFQVTLSGATGGVLGATSTATVNLSDNDIGVQFDPSAYTVTEGTASVTLSVKRSGPATAAASVQYMTANGTATAGADYTAKNGTLSWPAGDATPKTIVITIANDVTWSEGNETFTVTLMNPSVGVQLGAASVATVTIQDNDVPPLSTITFSQAKYEQTEGVGATVVLTVDRAALVAPPGDLNNTVTVSYATAPGTALAASDFVAKTGVLTFGPGVASQTITINLVNDALAEGVETFKVNLTTPSATLGILGIGSATVAIVDDDEIFPPDGILPGAWSIPPGPAGWHIAQDGIAADGALLLRSDNTVLDGQTASIQFEATFAAAGNVTFKYKVSSEAGADFLRFYVDGVKQGEWSGNVATWTLVTVPITAGFHTLLWTYEKDGSLFAGSDRAWIDTVTMPALAP